MQLQLKSVFLICNFFYWTFVSHFEWLHFRAVFHIIVFHFHRHFFQFQVLFSYLQFDFLSGTLSFQQHEAMWREKKKGCNIKFQSSSIFTDLQFKHIWTNFANILTLEKQEEKSKWGVKSLETLPAYPSFEASSPTHSRLLPHVFSTSNFSLGLAFRSHVHESSWYSTVAFFFDTRFAPLPRWELFRM